MANYNKQHLHGPSYRQQAQIDRDPILPPPRKHNLPPPPHPPKHAEARVSQSSTFTQPALLILDDPSDDLTEDEATDEDDMIGGRASAAAPSYQHASASSTLSHAHQIQVEDVCLVCRGSCRCGGARGAAVFVDSPARHRTATASSSSSVEYQSYAAKAAAASSQYFASEPQSGIVASAVRNRREADFTPDDVSRPIKKQRAARAAAQVAAVVTPATTPITGTSSGQPGGSRKTKVASSSASNRATAAGTPKVKPPKVPTTSSHKKREQPTITRGAAAPSRMSLRQVLAMSVREASASANNSEADTDGDVPNPSRVSSFPTASTAPLIERYEEPKENLSDISDLELMGDSDDESIEKAEEEALREEYERSHRDEDDDSVTELDEEDIDDDDEEDDEDETDDDLPWAKSRQRGNEAARAVQDHSKSPKVVAADVSTELPPDGGLGVVTWSDYGSVDISDDEVEERSQLAGDFEQELEELLSLSEAVVGPVRDDEVDLGELWFEEVTDNDGDDESGSAADNESEGEGDDDTEDDEDSASQQGQHAMLVVDGGWNHQTRSLSGSSAGDSDSEEFYYEDGDTTDTIDSDELVRFGIEVDDESESGFSDNDYYNGNPNTASLADVQAPTSADLASLPHYMLTGVGSHHLMRDIDADPQRQMMATEDLGVPVSRDSRKRTAGAAQLVSDSSKAKRKMVDIMEEDETAAGTGSDGETSKTPAMGVFSKKDRAPELAIVVIDGTSFAPSPFSKVKKNKKRHDHVIADGTPSRRIRADSKVSTTSVTDGSISGDVMDLPSPVLANVDLHFDLDDVLHESVLGDASSASLSDSDADVGKTTPRATGQPTQKSYSSALSDFSRWNRIPIGAFRSSTMPGGQQHTNLAAVNGDASRRSSSRHSRHHEHTSISMSNGVFSPGSAVSNSILRGPRAATSLNNTLSSPGASQRNNKRAIEKRMLTSPVFGPVPTGLLASTHMVVSSVNPRGSDRSSAQASASTSTGSGSTLINRKGKKKSSRAGSTSATSRQGLAAVASSSRLGVPAVSPFVAAVALPDL